MWIPAWPVARAWLGLAALLVPAGARAADIYVPAGGDLQAALNAARAGDTVLLAPGATYSGNFVLPVHGGTSHVTVRSAAPDSVLPPAGVRVSPSHSPHLPRIQSPNSSPALATGPGAAYWRLMFLEFPATQLGYYDIVTLGDGSGAQRSLADVPHHLVLDRVYVHGDPLHGQKRGISLNSGNTSIVNSHVSDIKAIGQDSVAIGGWNGPGPYLIENNYLEASGIVFLLGGADPSVPGLVPSDVVFRGNTVTRPLTWRAPIVPSPVNVGASSSAGGQLPAGTRHYAVVARRPVHVYTIPSELSGVVEVSTPAGGRVVVTWDAVPDATEYQVWRLVNGQAQAYWTVAGTTTFVDDGVRAPTSGTPGAAEPWSVKNLFELKNARRVEITRNTFTNNWAHAQTGPAILFTVRNQDGSCPWCVVEDIDFEYNVLRGAGGGIVVLGWDDLQSAQQAKRIRIRHNVASDLGWQWGGNGYFLQLIDGPRDIVVDHNTVISEHAVGVLVVDSRTPIYGVTFTNNVAWHNEYGVIGAGTGIGIDTITSFMPDAVFARNVFAARPWPYAYPSDHLFPSGPEFKAHFTDYSGGDYSLKPGTDWAGAGTDGQDLGANLREISSKLPSGPTAPRNPRLALQTN